MNVVDSSAIIAIFRQKMMPAICPALAADDDPIVSAANVVEISMSAPV